MNQTLCNLTDKHCSPCEGGVLPLTPEQAKELMKNLHSDWVLVSNATIIRREFKFKGFAKTMFFINAMAQIADQEQHHPDFEAGYNYCTVHYSTHAISGLSENDFICAAKIDSIVAR